MGDPIFDAIPGTRRSRTDVERIVVRLRRLLVEDPLDAAARGALDAARWTLREASQSPLSRDRAADVLGCEAERELARNVTLGLVAGDQERAAGVRAWMEWWLLIAAAPAWMSPTPRPGH